MQWKKNPFRGNWKANKEHMANSEHECVSVRDSCLFSIPLSQKLKIKRFITTLFIIKAWLKFHATVLIIPRIYVYY